MFKKLTEKLAKNRFLLKPFLILCLIYLLGFSAIILAGVHYADDAARTTYGYDGWSFFSRYLSTALSHGLHADSYLTNIAPLPQIIAVGCLAASSLALICVVSGKELFLKPWTKWMPSIIAATLLGFCPYFFECMSYQYDAPYMALSMLFAIVPFLFRHGERKRYLAAVAIGILGACMTYQVSIGIFLVLLIFLAMKDWADGKDGKEILKFVLWSAGSALLALLVFQKCLMTTEDVYVSNEMPAISVFMAEFLKHLGQYCGLIGEDAKVLWLILAGLMGVGFVILFVLGSKRNKILASLIAAVGLFCMAMAAYTPYSMLTEPLYAARAMYAIGAVIAILGIYTASRAANFKRGWQKLVAVPAMVLAWCFFVFAFTYGNALKEQDTYRNMQITMVTSDLNELLPKIDSKNVAVQVSGQIDYSPVIRNMPEDTRRALHRLLKSSFGRNTAWMAYRVTEGPWLMDVTRRADENLTERNLPVLRDTALYKIRGDQDNILVEFKGEEFDVSF